MDAVKLHSQASLARLVAGLKWPVCRCLRQPKTSRSPGPIPIPHVRYARRLERPRSTGWGRSVSSRRDVRARLTDAGSQLLPAARQALAAADHAVNVARAAAAAREGIVRVGFPGYGACDVIDLALGAFADESAPLRVQTRQADFSDPSAGLEDARVDAAFVRLPISPAGLEMERLMSEPRVAVLPAWHPLAAGQSLTIAELLSERWLQMPTTDPAWRNFWLAAEHRQGAQPLLGPQIHTIEEQLAATTAGGYVSLTAQSVAAFYPRPGISYVPVENIAPSEVAIAWRRGDNRDAVQEFITAVRAIAASIRSPDRPSQRGAVHAFSQDPAP